MAIAFVKHIASAHTTGVSVTSIDIVVPAAGVAAGNSIIISAVGNAAHVITGVTDSAGNTYAVDVTNVAGSGNAIASAHNVNALTSGQIITVTMSASGDIAAIASEFSGLATSGTLDKTATGTGTSTTPATSATATTSQADELLIGSVIWSNNTTFTQGASYTLVAQDQSTVNVRGNAQEYQIVSASGAYIADGTLSVSRQWAAAIATYKAAGGAAVHAKGKVNTTPLASKLRGLIS